MSRIKAGYWWLMLARTFDAVDREYIQRALEAEKKEKGHECGHEFTIRVSSRLHTSGPGEHRDADWDGDLNEVKVRAHNLRDALLVAASLPLIEWLREEEDTTEKESD